MDIHQIQLRYDPRADRILLKVSTRQAQLHAAWLTRRMMIRMWPHLQEAATRSDIATQVPSLAAVMPEARPMLAQVARERPLQTARFDQPFQVPSKQVTVSPEGQATAVTPAPPEPLLPTAMDLGHGQNGQGLSLRLREEVPAGRSFSLQLGAELTTALMRLLTQALQEADWGFLLPPAPAAGEAPRETRVLN